MRAIKKFAIKTLAVLVVGTAVAACLTVANQTALARGHFSESTSGHSRWTKTCCRHHARHQPTDRQSAAEACEAHSHQSAHPGEQQKRGRKSASQD